MRELTRAAVLLLILVNGSLITADITITLIMAIFKLPPRGLILDLTTSIIAAILLLLWVMRSGNESKEK